MHAGEGRLIDLLRVTPQFVIPVFQRPYAWTAAEVGKLWADILAAGRNSGRMSHFLGAVVHIEDKPGTLLRPSQSLIIDGQQRMTTVMLLIEAIARKLGADEPTEGLTQEALRSYYLLNMPERGERRYKLLLSRRDDASLRNILDRTPPPMQASEVVERNFGWFWNQVKADPSQIVTLWRGIQKMMIVEVKLNRNEDDPQLIFESMNATGLGLTQADLIRNFVLMGLAPELQTRLYDGYWKPMEDEFGAANFWRFDRFMRHFLTLRTGILNRESDVYKAFKVYATGDNGRVDSDGICADLRACAAAYARFACGREQDKSLAEGFADLEQLGIEACHPLLLALCVAQAEGKLRNQEVVTLARVIERYLFRRAVVWLPTNSLNRFFALITAAIGDGRLDVSDPDAILSALVKQDGPQRFPDDGEMETAVLTQNAYNRGHVLYWLQRLENDKHKERVPLADYTIEHIMPQNEKLSAKWREDLGPDWQRIHTELLHRIGNLTLTGYNSEYRDHPFQTKRDMEKGFKDSHVALNQSISKLERWDEAAIRRRGQETLQATLHIWPRPQVQQRHMVPTQAVAFQGPASALYAALRDAVLRFCPNALEEATDRGNAFSDGEIFAWVQMSGDGLAVILAADAASLDDSRGMAVATSSTDRPQVEVPLRSLDDTTYVAGLAFQASQKVIV